MNTCDFWYIMHIWFLIHHAYQHISNYIIYRLLHMCNQKKNIYIQNIYTYTYMHQYASYFFSKNWFRKIVSCYIYFPSDGPRLRKWWKRWLPDCRSIKDGSTWKTVRLEVFKIARRCMICTTAHPSMKDWPRPWNKRPSNWRTGRALGNRKLAIRFGGFVTKGSRRNDHRNLRNLALL